MRTNQLRHLNRFIRLAKQEEFLAKSLTSKKARKPVDQCGKINIPSEFNAKDWLSFLLHIDAELEHGLMVQYLYGAYSMGGDHIKEKDKHTVRKWQEIVLGISKEEMGHLVSVQNVLRVIGAPLNFSRQDFPWDTDLYPFPFKLEPFTKESLAKYIYAESPENWINIKKEDTKEEKQIKIEIKILLKQGVNEDQLGDPISCIFKEVLALLNDTKLIPDSLFQAGSYPFQAKFDEWGRGYKDGARGNSMAGSPKGAPNVLVAPLMSRTDAINAVTEIAEQGESTEIKNADELSHFERFLSIYIEWRKMPKDFMPSRNIATNPTIQNGAADPEFSPATGQVANDEIDYIIDPITKEWASLFDIRYRMLLNFLSHSFLLDAGYNNSGAHSPRGTIIHATFGEMYNLRSLSHVLMKMPLGGKTDKCAGPPFTVPYTLDLPIGEANRWRMHQDLLEASQALTEKLLISADESQKTYLYSLREADTKLNAIAEEITNQAN
jgi:hypothetical protein